jgi:hypothetical protein
MDSVVNKSVLPQSTVLYRAVNSGAVAGASVGDVLHQKAYTSTSLDEAYARRLLTDPEHGIVDPVLMRVRAPRGAHAALLDQYSGAQGNESEVLLGRDARLRFLGKSDDGYYDYELTS